MHTSPCAPPKAAATKEHSRHRSFCCRLRWYTDQILQGDGISPGRYLMCISSYIHTGIIGVLYGILQKDLSYGFAGECKEKR